VGSITSGTLYFDDFESRRFSYIGTLTDPGVEKQSDPSRPSDTLPKSDEKNFVYGFKAPIVGFGEGWGGVRCKIKSVSGATSARPFCVSPKNMTGLQRVMVNHVFRVDTGHDKSGVR
jgi:hypothetical protein